MKTRYKKLNISLDKVINVCHTYVVDSFFVFDNEVGNRLIKSQQKRKLTMREILLRDNTSQDFRKKDIRIMEKLHQCDKDAVCSKHARYIVNVLGKIDDVSNLDEVFIKQLLSKKDSKKQVYIKKEVSKKKGIKKITWKTIGCIYIVKNNTLLKIKYEYEIKIKIYFISSFKNNHSSN